MAAVPVLVLQGVGKDYAATVLDGVGLAPPAGEVLALTGENGAGKSTLSKIVCGLVAPTRGSMQLGGQPFAPRSRREAEAAGGGGGRPGVGGGGGCCVVGGWGLGSRWGGGGVWLGGGAGGRGGWVGGARLRALAER